MKLMLLFQSLSPLAILTLIKNFPIVSLDPLVCSDSVYLWIVDIACVVWIIFSIYCYISFLAFAWTDKENGYHVINVTEKEESGVNYYLTIIIPLLIDDVDTLRGATTLGLSVAFLCFLLYKTQMFYLNSVLAALGYRFYEFEFTNNNQLDGKCVGISKGEISNQCMVEYKIISDNVLFVRSMKNEKGRITRAN